MHRLLVFAAVLLFSGIAYALFYRLTDIGIPCIFKLITGFKCPGCGVTRMLMSLMRLDFKKAWEYNSMLLCLLLPMLAVFINGAVRYVKLGTKTLSKWATALTSIMVVLLIIFGVWRNLPISY